LTVTNLNNCDLKVINIFYTVRVMKLHTLPITLSLTVIALLILTQAGAQGVEWKVWVNPRQDTGLPKTYVELNCIRSDPLPGYG
jgi:hypothetical protein